MNENEVFNCYYWLSFCLCKLAVLRNKATSGGSGSCHHVSVGSELNMCHNQSCFSGYYLRQQLFGKSVCCLAKTDFLPTPYWLEQNQFQHPKLGKRTKSLMQAWILLTLVQRSVLPPATAPTECVLYWCMGANVKHVAAWGYEEKKKNHNIWSSWVYICFTYLVMLFTFCTLNIS